MEIGSRPDLVHQLCSGEPLIDRQPLEHPLVVQLSYHV